MTAKKASDQSTTKSQNKHCLTDLIRRTLFSSPKKTYKHSYLKFIFLPLTLCKAAKIRERAGKNHLHTQSRFIYTPSWFSLAQPRFSLSIKTRNESSEIYPTSQESFVCFPADASGLQFFYNYKLSHTQKRAYGWIFFSSFFYLLIVWCKRQKEGIDNVKILIVSHLGKLL